MAYRSDPPMIPLEQLQWQDVSEVDGAGTRLLAHIRIGYLDMHLEAREMVSHGKEDQWTIEYPNDHEDLANMADTYFTALEINGREYFLFALPYGV